MKYFTFIALFVLFIFTSSFSGIIYVPNDTTSIQGGIYLSNNGDTILVDDGTYYENINFKGKAITVASRFLIDGDTSHISNTIIDGSQPSNPDSGSVVYFISGEDTNSVLEGFTITGGTGHFNPAGARTGGGIFLWAGAKIENNKIINNHINTPVNIYAHGGGIHVHAETENVIIRNNTIENNTINGWWGGGAGVVMICADAAAILFDRNVLKDNIYNASGGLCAGGASIAGGAGWNGRIVISNNIVLRNQAISTNANNGLAGGIYIESASPEIYNNIIAENTTSGSGGGIFVGTNSAGSAGNPIFINNSIIKNNALIGGGFYNEWTTNNPIVLNCIFWGNNASTGNEIYRQQGTVTVVYSDVAGGYTGPGNISKEPMLRGDDYHLSDSSSCIGAGIDSIEIGGTWYHCPITCFLGHARPTPSNSMPDMGACESSLGSPVVSLETVFSDNLPKFYDLRQNYPNPFNLTTTIEFDLPKAGEASLKIFNILGEEVTTLLSDKLSTGSYSYKWDAGHLASGVYLYRLEAEGFVQTRKMILMK